MGQRNPAPPKGWLKPYKEWEKPSQWRRISQPSTVAIDSNICGSFWGLNFDSHLTRISRMDGFRIQDGIFGHCDVFFCAANPTISILGAI